jgi:hypothetical protein
MQVVKISQVKPNPNNPRLIKDDKFQKLVESLRSFPEMAKVRPIVVNKDMIVLGGNMRLKAMKEAGWKEVPVEVVDWDEDKQREFIIKDNVGYGEWDWAMIANEWDAEQVTDWGLDIPQQKNDKEEIYTTKIESPIYTPKEKQRPKINELYDLKTYEDIINEIEASDLNKDEKEFLKLAATRHIKINYAKVAEYYSHSEKNVKKLFENNALVIVDYGKAIEKGFVELFETFEALSNE